MKVSKSINMDIDVDVDISLEDITYAIVENMDSARKAVSRPHFCYVFQGTKLRKKIFICTNHGR